MSSLKATEFNDQFKQHFRLKKLSNITSIVRWKWNNIAVPVLKQLQPVRHTFSSPEPTILLVCARDRDLWQGPKQEVRESRTSGFCAQPQKFETTTVTIGYKNGQLLRLRVTWSLPEVSIPGSDQKDRGLWGREWSAILNFSRVKRQRACSVAILWRFLRNIF